MWVNITIFHNAYAFNVYYELMIQIDVILKLMIQFGEFQVSLLRLRWQIVISDLVRNSPPSWF